MAVPSSSSCEVVDLALAASRDDDDATSQLFFSKAGGGGGDCDLSWPAAAKIESKLPKQESLVALCDSYGVPRVFKPLRADILRCAACETPPPPQQQKQGSSSSDALCVYCDALDAGLRFPLHDFYLKLLRHYRLAPSQLVPNAWKYMAAFVLRCKDAGVEPLVSTFRYFFSLYAHRHNKDDKPTGWHHFQPCAGRPRLFSGTWPTRHDWKTRFFFLRSPEGMPWKCPVAWGKPRMEDACTVELTDATIDKLKQMPCVDLKLYLSLHAPPVGVGGAPAPAPAPTPTMLQLQLHCSTPPAPMAKPKPECAAASARAQAFSFTTTLHQLHAGAGGKLAGDNDDSTPPRKRRRCPGPAAPAAAVTVTPQSFTISAAPPPSLQRMEITPGSNSDDFMYGGMVRMQQDEQRDNRIAQLQAKLRESEAVRDKFFEYLYKERARLMEQQAAVVARVKAERAAEVAKLREEHASAVEQLTKHLNDEHAADLARVKDAAEKKVQDVMKNVVRSLFPEADLSQFDSPKLIKGDLAAAGTPEAEGTSAT